MSEITSWIIRWDQKKKKKKKEWIVSFKRWNIEARTYEHCEISDVEINRVILAQLRDFVALARWLTSYER